MLNTVSYTPISLVDIEVEMNRLLLLEQSYVTEAACYHLSAGGTRVRAQIGLEAAEVLSLSRQTAMACSIAPELLHNASLIHDDLQDGDVTRRDKPAVWSQYGKAIGLATGDFLISTAYLTLATHPLPKLALSAMHTAISVTIRGQMQDCHKVYHSLDQYVEIAANKSGPLLALPVCLALIAAEEPGQDTAVRAARALAIAYQTLDDFADKAIDQSNGSANICLFLEATGLSADVAAATACNRAYDSLSIARQEANTLPRAVGTSFLKLADRLDDQLKDITDAA